MSEETAPIPEMSRRPKEQYPKESMFTTFASYTTSAQNFLTEYKAASPLFPKLFETVSTISYDSTLLAGFLKLMELKILSLPMVTDKKLEGIFSVQDFLNILISHCPEKEISSLKGDDEFRSYLAEKEFVNKKLSQFPEIGKIDPIVTCKPTDTILHIAQLMIQHNSHRVLVVDDGGNLINLITQSRLVALLSTVLDTIPDSIKSLKELNLGFKEIISINVNSTAYQAFNLIREKKLVAIAVVDEQGKLIGNVSSSDLKALGHKLEFFQLITEPLSKYLQVIRTKSEIIGLKSIDRLVLSVKSEDSLACVLNMLYTYRVHRVYIVDNESKPIGVVSLTDVLRQIVAPFTKGAD